MRETVRLLFPSSFRLLSPSPVAAGQLRLIASIVLSTFFWKALVTLSDLYLTFSSRRRVQAYAPDANKPAPPREAPHTAQMASERGWRTSSVRDWRSRRWKNRRADGGEDGRVVTDALEDAGGLRGWTNTRHEGVTDRRNRKC